MLVSSCASLVIVVLLSVPKQCLVSCFFFFYATFFSSVFPAARYLYIVVDAYSILVVAVY